MRAGIFPFLTVTVLSIAPLVASAVEYPLEEWTDVPGSKIGFSDFLVMFMELCKIFHFLRFPGAERRFTKWKNEPSQ